MRVLDTINAPAEGGGGATTPVGGFCSAHWFDFHPSGIVAIGHYQQGLRLIDVRNPRDLKQFGFFTGGGTEVWDAYWAPERDESGAAVPGRKTNIVYTVDAVRGVEVFEVTDLPPDLPVTGDDGGRGPFPTPPSKPGEETRPGEEFGATPGSCRRLALPGPTSRFTRGSRLTSRGLRLRGTARGRGCAVRRMAVAVGPQDRPASAASCARTGASARGAAACARSTCPRRARRSGRSIATCVCRAGPTWSGRARSTPRATSRRRRIAATCCGLGCGSTGVD